MPLYLVSDELKERMGARCLDGSNPGFYFQSAAPNSTTPNSWVLYFKGGGWCYDEADCADRAKGALGSSKHFPKTWDFSGPMDSDPAINPDFANFNRVVLWYCDGASFSGMRRDPYFYKQENQLLYFRGRFVLDAILETLLSDHGLAKAAEVLVSGGSAGGLAAYLHADYIEEKIKEFLPSRQGKLVKFKAAPVSGFFLMHQSVNGTPVYPNHLQYVFNMQNSTGGVNKGCIAALHPAEHWKCIFANYSYAYSRTPMFPLQSALDGWQMANIWLGDKRCRHNNFQQCTPQEIDDLNRYAAAMVADYQRTEKYQRNGEGGFVESCLEHVAAQGASFNKYTIRGKTMQKALSKWWHAPTNDPASAHWFLPCELNSKSPHQCNPSCASQSLDTAVLV